MFGSSESDRMKNFEIMNIKNAFQNHPSFVKVVVNNHEIVEAIVTDNSDIKDQKGIASIDHIFSNGDIVEWQNNKWINILTDNVSDVYSRGVLRPCHGQLKWIDNEGETKERYFTFKSDPATNFGVDEGLVITLGNERRNLLVGFDDATEHLRKDRRFIFDSRAWKITALDNISTQGFSVISVQEDLLDPAKDNLELGIADYYGNVADYSIEFVNLSFSSISLDQTFHVEAVVKNKNKVIEDAKVLFSVDDELAEIDSKGLFTPKEIGQCTVTASYKNVTASIAINITPTRNNNYTVTISGDDSIVASRTKKYSCQFYNNGVSYTGESFFYITAEDGVSDTKLATIVSQDSVLNSCEIKAGRELGSFILHVKNTNGLSATSKKIKVKSLL